MTKRYYGGVISASKVTANAQVATGIFNLSDATQGIQSNGWPLPVAGDSYQPPGTTRVLLINFNNGSLNKSGTYTTTGGTGLTLPTTNGVSNTGYATGWSLTNSNNYIDITNFSTVANMKNVTVMAWYKGTQTASSSQFYNPGVPVFGEITNQVYWGIGMDAGKICVASDGTVSRGTTNVNSNTWVHLAWTISSTTVVNAYVNGVKEITNRQANSSYPGIRYLGTGYAYAGVEPPTALDGVQVYSGVLSDADILSIYNAGK